jgi:hypothetical protein
MLHLINPSVPDLSNNVQVNIKKPTFLTKYWSICFLGPSRLCLIFKIESKDFDNALVLIQFYDHEEPIVWPPVLLKQGEIRNHPETSLSHLLEA